MIAAVVFRYVRKSGADAWDGTTASVARSIIRVARRRRRKKGTDSEGVSGPLFVLVMAPFFHHHFVVFDIQKLNKIYFMSHSYTFRILNVKFIFIEIMNYNALL
jgi:hypothetical protein